MKPALDLTAVGEAAQDFSDTADKLTAIGKPAPEILAGLHNALCLYGEQAFGTIGLVEWLRNTADRIERKVMRG